MSKTQTSTLGSTIYMPKEDLNDLKKLMKGKGFDFEMGAVKKTSKGLVPGKDGEKVELEMGGVAQESNIKTIDVKEKTVSYPLIQEALRVALTQATTKQESLRLQKISDGIMDRMTHYHDTGEIKIFGKEGSLGNFLGKDHGHDHNATYVYGGE